MGEIKSTMDIIMEKVKAISVTDEEKEAFQKREVEGKVRGFLQKYLDGLMDIDAITERVVQFNEKQESIAKEALKKECLHRMDPEADNSPLLEVLEHVAGEGTQSLHKILSEFHRNLDKKKRGMEKDFLKRLKKEGISGSAVIPNFEADPEWKGFMSKMKEAFRKEVEGVMPA